MQNDNLMFSIIGLLIASQCFWEFLKWLIDKVVSSFSGEKKITLTEINVKLDSQRKDIDDLKDAFTKMQGIESKEEAKSARRRILKFNDELLRGLKHSKEYFDDILEDVKTYEDYCNSHPDFQNGKTVMADKNIRRCYEICTVDNSFLH